MRRFFSILPLLAGILSLSGMAAPAHAESGIHDDAGLFKPETMATAKDLIHQIHGKSGHEVFVQTVPTIPADRQDELTNKGRQRFYADWAEDVGKQFGVQGIVILLVKDPGHLEVAVGNKTRQEAFTLNSRDELDAKMLPILREKDFDGALITGLNFINDRIKVKAGANANTPYVPATPGYSPPRSVSPGGPSHWGGLVCLGIVMIVIVAIVIGAVSRSRGYNAGYGAPPPGGYPPGYGGGYGGGGYYGGGGGGFGRGLLGGLLGGALGAWGYDRFFQGGNQSTNYIPPQQGEPPDSTGDTSYSSTGGDFGSSSTGGDFGSSSSSDSSGGGGGDFGGGGGGDFGGGGGGDSGGGSSGGDF